MIVKETVTYFGEEYDKTYSDKGMNIERDGQLYGEAVDPKGSEREYTETDIPIGEPIIGVSDTEEQEV